MKKVAWFVFFSIIAVSCLDEPDCFQLNNNVVIVAFGILGGGADAIALTEVRSPGVDSVFYPNTIISQVPLPLDPMEDNTEFIFKTSTGDYRLHISYTRQVQFVSADCGERYTFSNLKIEGHDFDTIRLANPTPTRPASPNFVIYRCAQTDMMGIRFPATTTAVIDSISADYLDSRYYIGDTVSSINLPVNLLADKTTFTFKFRNNPVKERLTVKYERTLRTLAAFCGEQQLVGNLVIDKALTDFSVTTSIKDSIQDLPQINFEITP